MSWIEHARRELPERLDDNGDLPPPWVAFPTYERYTIGWRMGAGESYLCLWHVFLEGLAQDRETRLAFLKRHPAAPIDWADSVYAVLNPGKDLIDPDNEDDPDPDERRAAYLAEGLIACDASYTIWRAANDEIRWPWKDSRSPITAARYRTRELWFWSRRVQEMRDDGSFRHPALPWGWRSCAAPLRIGAVPRPNPRQGLLTLAKMLCAGRVQPPWELGLPPESFKDSFDDHMGYADAYRLWCMSALDDTWLVEHFCQPESAPPAWRPWLSVHAAAD